MSAKNPTAAEIRAMVEEPEVMDPLDLIRTSPALVPVWMKLAEEGKALRENNERCRAERLAREARKAKKAAAGVTEQSGR